MSRAKLVLTIGVLAMFSAPAFAADSVLYFTGREYRAGATGFINGGTIGPAQDFVPPSNPALPAGNPTIFLQPKLPAPNNRHVLGTDDTSNKNVQLWMSVGEKYVGANTEELMSSIGVTLRAASVAAVEGTNASRPAPATSVRGTLTQTWTTYTLPSATNAAGTQMWDGTNVVGAPAAFIQNTNDLAVNDSRMVSVPPNIAGFANGGVPTTTTGNAGLLGGSYRIATLGLQAKGPNNAALGCKNQLPSRYSLFIQVGPVLDTRVANPAVASPTQETVAFGYSGAVPETVGIPGGCTATASGSCVGAESASADLTVDVRFKGDAAGGGAGAVYPDGVVDSADNSAQAQAKVQAGAAPIDRKFTFDFAGGGGGALEPDGVVDSADNSGFATQKKVFAGVGGETAPGVCP